MSANRKAIWAGVIVCALASGSCSKAGRPGGGGGGGKGGQGHGQHDNRTFNVYIYTPDPSHPEVCYPDLAVVTVWRTHGQQVRWISDDQRAYTVDFTPDAGAHGSPFPGHDSFKVPKTDPNGVPSGVANRSGYFNYAIRNEANTICDKANDPADPGVHITP